MPVHEIPLHVPRSAISPRQVARSGDVWRLFQEAAVLASTQAGWPPERYLEEGTGFIVYAMVVRHLRELRYGESTQATTWVSAVKRETLTSRETRLTGTDGPVAATTQQWAHVARSMRPVRASAALVEAFPPMDGPDSPLAFPTLPDPAGPVHQLTFDVWHTQMDSLGHVNHPVYIDFCDEALAQIAASEGLDPQGWQPLWEEIQWKGGAVAGDTLTVSTQEIPGCADGRGFVHEIHNQQGKRIARARTVRRISGIVEA